MPCRTVRLWSSCIIAGTRAIVLSLCLNPGLKDIGPLANLQNLRELTINSRSITDLSPLRNLTDLQTADIRAYGSVEITDWSPVEHVPNLIKG